MGANQPRAPVVKVTQVKAGHGGEGSVRLPTAFITKLGTLIM